MSQRLEHDWFPESLPANVTLGERTWLYSSYAFRHYHSRQTQGLVVGHDSGLYNGTFFDVGPAGQVKIGNYCTLVGAIICTNSRVLIDDYALIAHEVVIADSPSAIPSWEPSRAIVTADSHLRSRGEREASIVIGENAWIGTRAVLLQGAYIGEGSIVGAGTVIDFRVPPYCIVAGNPARIVKEIRRYK